MSETGGTVAIVVVAHDSGALLADCVARAAAAERCAELVVVDNASRDGSVERAAAAAPIRIVRNADNPGFATACNQGAAATDAPWLLFLNPDCLIESDTLRRLLEVAARIEALGVLGADVRDPRGVAEAAARRAEPTFARAAARALGRTDALAALDAGVGRADASLEARDASRDVTRVDAVSGALMLLRREVFDRLGGFDPRYRLHCEDLDLCRRARDAGLVVAVAEAVAVRHAKGTSSRARPYFVQWHKVRGMWRYYLKFEGRSHDPVRRALVFAGLSGYAALGFAKIAASRARGAR